MTRCCSWALDRECSPEEWAVLRAAVYALAHTGLPALRAALGQAPAPPGVWEWAWRRRQRAVLRANAPAFVAAPGAWEDGERLEIRPAPALWQRGNNPHEQPVRIYRLPHQGAVRWMDSLHGWVWAGALVQETAKPSSPWHILETSVGAADWAALQRWSSETLSSAN